MWLEEQEQKVERLEYKTYVVGTAEGHLTGKLKNTTSQKSANRTCQRLAECRESCRGLEEACTQ